MLFPKAPVHGNTSNTSAAKVRPTDSKTYSMTQSSFSDNGNALTLHFNSTSFQKSPQKMLTPTSVLQQMSMEEPYALFCWMLLRVGSLSFYHTHVDLITTYHRLYSLYDLSYLYWIMRNYETNMCLQWDSRREKNSKNHKEKVRFQMQYIRNDLISDIFFLFIYFSLGMFVDCRGHGLTSYQEKQSF